jgi:predicted nucleic acid-binding Zn ribbon protein
MNDLVPIASLLGKMPAAPRSDAAVIGLRQVWEQALGADVARHAHPVRLTGDTLVVHCSSATWASELTLLGAHIAARLAEVVGAGAPAALRFQVGELPVAVDGAESAVPALRPARSQLPVEQLTGDVVDPELRAALERAMRTLGAPTL